ncbi:hypothetical protein Hdeb2414_s0398g00886111 [Helianthus debilis subsp. tardiflorus]
MENKHPPPVPPSFTEELFGDGGSQSSSTGIFSSISLRRDSQDSDSEEELVIMVDDTIEGMD